MENDQNSKKYDLEERTLRFAKDVRIFIKMLSKTPANIEDIKQVIRSSGSIGANYIEANEAVSKKDTLYRMKVCRKESKETRYWFRLLDTDENKNLEMKRDELIQEATELMNIFGAIIKKLE